MREPTSAIAGRAAAALIIRRATAPLLLHGIVRLQAWQRAAAMDLDAWRLFLRTERCALRLQHVLRHPLVDGHGGRVPATVGASTPGATRPGAGRMRASLRSLLTVAAQRETARLLVARAHLRTAATTAAALGIRAIVLKGGVLACGHDALDLTDVDLLVPADRTTAFVRALEAHGWTATDERSDRVSQTLLANSLRVEIHSKLGLRPDARECGLWQRAEPLEACPPLWRLGPSDALHHGVQHVALDHPNRRVRLRDLLLIAHVARRCPPGDLASAYVDDCEAARDPRGIGLREAQERRACRAVLEAAAGTPGDDGEAPHLERAALAAYVMALRAPLPLVSREVNEFVDAWSVSALQGSWERRQLWAGAYVEALGPSSWRAIRAIEQRSARAGRWWRITARLAYRAATWLMARPIAARARRRVDRAWHAAQLIASAVPLD